MRCIQCDRECGQNKILMTIDGDFVCSEACRQSFYADMTRISEMSDDQFERYMAMIPPPS